MANELITYEIPALVPTPIAKARLEEIRQFVREELKEGLDQDYAVIPGTGKKPSLLQPGAEKLIEKLGLAPTFPLKEWAVEDHNEGRYMVDTLCRLINLYTERVQAECWGSAARSAQEEVDESNAKTREWATRDGKPMPEPKPLRFSHMGLARNAALKMAQKSALVGATLKAARLAVDFTQDVEDFGRPSGESAATNAAATQPGGEHWCSRHKTEWFKRGKMTSYAHSDGDDGKWCYQPSAKAPEPPTAPKATGVIDVPAVQPPVPHAPEQAPPEDLGEAFPPEPATDISPNDLIELAKQVGWSSQVLLTRMRQKFVMPNTSLPNFTPAQRLETAEKIRHILADQKLAEAG